MFNSNTLRDILETKFSEEELRTLCVDLDLDYANLSGENKEAKARELVAYFERRDDLNSLVTTVQKLRPNIIINEMRPIYRRVQRKEYHVPSQLINDANLSQGQFDRLIAAVDRLTDRLGALSTETALLTQRMVSIEGRLVSVEGQIRDFTGNKPASWQTYLLITLGLCIAVAIAILFYGLGK